MKRIKILMHECRRDLPLKLNRVPVENNYVLWVWQWPWHGGLGLDSLWIGTATPDIRSIWVHECCVYYLKPFFVIALHIWCFNCVNKFPTIIRKFSVNFTIVYNLHIIIWSRKIRCFKKCLKSTFHIRWIHFIILFCLFGRRSH